MARLRADQFLVEHGFFESRSRAQTAIAAGLVTADGVTVRKPSETIPEGASVSAQAPHPYVSRGGLKLAAALDAYGTVVDGLRALDVGASTGGFTDVLLGRGAAHVVAVDVGHGQIDAALAADPRVTSIEGVNARELDARIVGSGPFDVIVCDVSFISLKLALPPALALAAPDASGLFLVKPQFEAGRQAIGKGGMLRDASLGPAIAADLSDWLDTQPDWQARGTMPSPIVGADGNHEYLLAGRKHA